MKIVNPLYDNAFKYLMDNEQIAKIALSIILGENVVSLQSKPQETPVTIDDKRGVARYDFKAIIRNPQNQERSVLIELQKYKTPDPILRFREYLAENYKKEETIVNSGGGEIKQVLPIITIYILGYNITKSEILAMKVDRNIKDLIWEKPIDELPEFIELLTHTSIILQVSAKPKELRHTRLEKFINLFSQKLKGDVANYIIDLKTDTVSQYDSELNSIVEHLNKATLDDKVVRSLKLEESYEKGIRQMEKDLKESLKKIEKAQSVAKKERAEKEKAEAIAKKERAEKEKERAEKEASQKREQDAQKEKEEIRNKLNSSILKQHQKGKTAEEIADDFELSIEEVMKIIEASGK